MARTLTTLYHFNPQRLRERGQHEMAASLPWEPETDFIDPAEHSTAGLVRELVRRASDYDVLVLNTSARRDQVAAAALRRTRTKTGLVLNDCTWKVESAAAARWLSRLGIRTMDGPRTHYCVLSSDEERAFPGTWGVASQRVHFTPWYFWHSVEEAAMPVAEDGFVFSGGDSMRDYRPLIDAARELRAEVRVAAHQAPPVAEGELPANLTWGSLSPEDYFETMCRASVVVMPLVAESERSAGQQSYLNPMAKGKLVVVNDAPGVRDYIRDRETGLIVPNDDPAALAEALSWALEPSNSAAVRDIGVNAKRDVGERFPLKRYIGKVVDIAREVGTS